MHPALSAQLTRLVDQVSTIIVGKRPQIEDCVACLLAGGHADRGRSGGRQDDARACARGLAGPAFLALAVHRADLMPSDLIGVSVYERGQAAFVFHQGPVFTQVLLADEINRAGPKTQARCSKRWRNTRSASKAKPRAAGRRFRDRDACRAGDAGTYPLPESQLDRFLMCITLGYPTRQANALLAGQDRREAIHALQPVVTPEELRAARGGAGGARLGRAARLPAGADRRDAQRPLVRRRPVAARRHRHALRAARAHALLQRDYVAPDDIQAVLSQTIAHRLVPVAGAGRGRIEQVRALVEAVALP